MAASATSEKSTTLTDVTVRLRRTGDGRHVMEAGMMRVMARSFLD
jgi:hypothetical protein